MRRILFMLASVANSASATWVGEFKGWDDLTRKSSDIIIVRCIATPSKSEGLVTDGVVAAEIEVISVLKGKTSPGQTRMFSQYQPRQGQRFLVFGAYHSVDNWPGYAATEQYRVIPIGEGFQLEELKGKALAEQIRTLLERRVDDVKIEQKRLSLEKDRLEWK